MKLTTSIASLAAAAMAQLSVADPTITDVTHTSTIRGNGMVDISDGLAFGSADAVSSVSCERTPAPYCVIDLSEGANASSYPVTYLASPPSGGFNVDEFKTTKLVLRCIVPGTFQLGGSYPTTLTKPYYIGVFEVTLKQYRLVMGSIPSFFYEGGMRPVECVSYNTIRGSTDGAQWPASNAVDAASFLGKLRARTGIDFDLPTEAQWEYACRAGTTTDFNNGTNCDGNYQDDPNLNLLGRYRGKCSDGKGGYTAHTVVGSYQPNAWGLYDMHGNVWEWCLDWYGDLSGGTSDPKGSSSGSYRVLRGGGWTFDADFCASGSRLCSNPSRGGYNEGFRLACALSVQ